MPKMWKFHAIYIASKLRRIIMLILTRRVGESIMLKDDIEIILLGLKGNQARIGIEAPEEISVHRKEIYNKILKANNVCSIEDAPKFEKGE